MKRFSKIILILAGFCFLFGTAITVAAASLGGRIPEAVVFNGDWIDYFDHKYEGFSRREPVKITVNRLGSEEWSAEEGGYLKKLNLSVGAAKIRIVEGAAEDSIYVKDATDYIQWEQNMDEDTLELNFYRDKRFRRHISTESAYAVLVIPKGYEFNEVEIQVGAGVLEAESLTARELDLEGGAGAISINSGKVQELDIDVQAGSVVYSGEVGSSLIADCQAGGVELSLKGEPEDFNYELDVNMGSIQIGGQEYSGIEKEKTLISDSAVKKADLHCDVGSIEITFLGED